MCIQTHTHTHAHTCKQARQKEKRRKIEELEAKRLALEAEETLRSNEPQAWLLGARAKRNELYVRYERRAKRKVMGSERRSAASNERMRCVHTYTQTHTHTHRHTHARTHARAHTHAHTH